MAQVFPRGSNAIARVTLLGAVAVPAGLLLLLWLMVRTPYITGESVPVDQPIPFSHKHHVGDDGIDCRYCHTTAETSSFAGLPPTSTCMNCHAQIWAGSPALDTVRQSAQSGQPLTWTRVYQLPDYVYFNHSIHVQKGVACETCHGRVDEMPRIYKASSLTMGWCLDCHRDPQKNLRPRDEVTTMGWQPPANQPDLQRQLMRDYHVQSKTDCSTCHR